MNKTSKQSKKSVSPAPRASAFAAGRPSQAEQAVASPSPSRAAQSIRRDRVFIGLAWPYVNGDLHIGHVAGYLLPADVFARFNRFVGNEVLMVSGSDSHGTPITVEADQKKVDPQQIVREYHAKHKELFKRLNIDFDLYTTTTTANHKKVVQDVFIKLLEEGYIFKDSTKQFYSQKESRFLPDRYVEGVCAYCRHAGARSDQCDNCGRLLDEDTLNNPVSKITGEPVELKSTEHYFLDWPKFNSFLTKYVAARGEHWRKWVWAETRDWLKRGLKARAITRDINWGIEIPTKRMRPSERIDHAEDKRIYVWFEAVIGYLSASKEWAQNQGEPDLWQKFWLDDWSDDVLDDRRGHVSADAAAGDTVDEQVNGTPDEPTKAKKSSAGSRAPLRQYYFVGKDNLVFHALFWPAQLYGYDKNLHLPDVPVVSQFLTLGGAQFSKSRGVTVDPLYVADHYGVDNLRFYLALIAPEQADSIFTWRDFVRQNNSLLIGTIGNFINRTLSLSQKLDLGAASKDVPPAVVKKVEQALKEAATALNNMELKKYTKLVAELADFGNKYLAQKEPWKIKDQTTEPYREIMAGALLIVLVLAVLLTPLTPKAVKKMHELLGLKIERWPAGGVATLIKLLPKLKLIKPKPIFAKIDPKVIAQEESKIKGTKQ